MRHVGTQPFGRYLNALAGKGVHVVTVNDYLAKRDAEWMGEVYKFLGLTVGCITNELNDDDRREAYGCDVTYGTNNEYGFDYLRDNMKFDLEEMVQRPFNFAIVDEVDSILIDEARTPLIISGPTDDTSELYVSVNKVIPGLNPEDYEVDEKQKTVALTDGGNEHLEALLAEAGLLGGHELYDMHNISVVHHANQALRAHTLFRHDTDYIVKNNQVIIIDEFTGRMMEGRRYSDGLHQALEAKEGVEIQTENQTVASITFQNYFRMYPKLAGMTGTAMTEASEFLDIYKLEVVDVPTNVAVERIDEDDEVYRTGEERDIAVLDLIEDCSKRGQPTLVGTVSIEKSELLAEKLGQRNIPHQVLNARHHEREAYIIAQGGEPGAVTIATNMAGRGTDIKLGGNPEMRIEQELGDMPAGPEHDGKEAEIRADVEAKRQKVVAAGGLFVIATERHESRRIDNQLRGRSGRQGDPGNSRFFLSLQDDLMRIFGSDRMDGWLQRLGLKEGEAVVHSWINKAIERAQRKVEERNYDIRKNLLKFDDVMNDQRKVIYAQRIGIMKTDDVSERIREYREEAVEAIVEDAIPERAYAEQWDVDGLYNRALGVFGLDLPVRKWVAEEGIADQEIYERILEAVNKRMAEKTADYSPEADASGRKEHPAADPRPAVEGASAPARPLAPGGEPAGLRPEGSADRIQARSLRHVPGYAVRPQGNHRGRSRPSGDRTGRRSGQPAARGREPVLGTVGARHGRRSGTVRPAAAGVAGGYGAHGRDGPGGAGARAGIHQRQRRRDCAGAHPAGRRPARSGKSGDLGARSRATRLALAVRAGNTSTVTAGSDDPRPVLRDGHYVLRDGRFVLRDGRFETALRASSTPSSG